MGLKVGINSISGRTDRLTDRQMIDDRRHEEGRWGRGGWEADVWYSIKGRHAGKQSDQSKLN